MASRGPAKARVSWEQPGTTAVNMYNLELQGGTANLTCMQLPYEIAKTIAIAPFVSGQTKS